MNMYPNCEGKLRTVEELREEYDTIARLYGQVCLAYADPNHPHVRVVNRQLDAAHNALRRAESS
jgi:hypothetical protein